MSSNLLDRRTPYLRHALLIVSVAALVTLYMVPASSVVWATPGQNRLLQTIPTLTPTPIPSWAWIGKVGDNPDYALRGVSDFDQKQASLYAGAAPQIWTHCGPVALANALWWLDSRYEPNPVPPPTLHDALPLVRTFGGGAWDDHDAQNTVPLIGDWADRLGTQEAGQQVGTDIAAVAPAVRDYLAEVGLQQTYTVTVVASPSFEQLLSWAHRESGVLLLLGFWEDQGDRWVYLGAHYATLAGAEPLNRYVAISDPYRDAWEAGECALGRAGATHSYPHESDLHNDAGYASHDAYRMLETTGPGGVGALENYVPAFAGVPNFARQNVAGDYASYLGSYSGSPLITTKVDFAVVLARRSDLYTIRLPMILKGSR